MRVRSFRQAMGTHEFLSFWRGYVTAVGFTATIDDENGSCDSAFPCVGEFSETYREDDILKVLSGSGRRELRHDALEFYREVCERFDTTDWSMDDWESCGTDFHFTRNGHGAGFWDGDWGEDGKVLAEMSKPYGPLEIHAWLGKRGKMNAELYS